MTTFKHIELNTSKTQLSDVARVISETPKFSVGIVRNVTVAAMPIQPNLVGATA